MTVQLIAGAITLSDTLSSGNKDQDSKNLGLIINILCFGMYFSSIIIKAISSIVHPYNLIVLGTLANIGGLSLNFMFPTNFSLWCIHVAVASLSCKLVNIGFVLVVLEIQPGAQGLALVQLINMGICMIVSLSAATLMVKNPRLMWGMQGSLMIVGLVAVILAGTCWVESDPADTDMENMSTTAMVQLAISMKGSAGALLQWQKGRERNLRRQISENSKKRMFYMNLEEDLEEEQIIAT